MPSGDPLQMSREQRKLWLTKPQRVPGLQGIRRPECKAKLALRARHRGMKLFMHDQAHGAPGNTGATDDASEATSGQRPAPLPAQQERCRETVEAPSVVCPISNTMIYPLFRLLFSQSWHTD
jgi:hypothetical protein